VTSGPSRLRVNEWREAREKERVATACRDRGESQVIVEKIRKKNGDTPVFCAKSAQVIERKEDAFRSGAKE
jgi:hypothetical protein